MKINLNPWLLSIFFCLFLLFNFSAIGQGEKAEFTELSYTEFFSQITEEEDAIFNLRNAVIKFNPKTDRRFAVSSKMRKYSLLDNAEEIVIDKAINLENVYFFKVNYSTDTTGKSFIGGFLNNIIFQKSVVFNQVAFSFFNCTFQDELLVFNSCLKDHLEEQYDYYYRESVFDFCVFRKKFLYEAYCEASESVFHEIRDNKFYLNDSLITDGLSFSVNLNGFYSAIIEHNQNIGEGISDFNISNFEFFNLKNNSFEKIFSLKVSEPIGDKRLTITGNNLEDSAILQFSELPSTYLIHWKQFENRILSLSAWDNYNLEKYIRNSKKSISDIFDIYADSLSIVNYDYYVSEAGLKGDLYSYYKSKYDNINKNLVYTELKDLETERYKYLYVSDPSFDSFFTWRIYQFLKVFSAYGTKPSKAIIISFYVILIFAGFYLLFPNSWDSLGRDRLLYRFEFFRKYLQREEGMHDLYLESKREELSTYDTFRKRMEESTLTLPKFFVRWSKPLYKFATLNSRLKSRILRRTDILKGTWKELSPSRKRVKNIQIGLFLTAGLLFDFAIKILNALMLSINTFSTLGFGEIPIKGLPRYLAIIEGFLGWFMLTIFSVSLISQLLN